MTMKKSLLVAAVAFSALFAGGAAMAQDASMSYNIEVTNNYVFRGISQDMNNTALQGGADYKQGTFYAGTWLSNVDFQSLKGKQANTEWDLYLGITPSLGDYNFDFGVIYYVYPGAEDATVGEFKSAVSHSMGKGTIGFAMYTPVKSLTHPDDEINASYPLTDKLSISGAIANNEANIDEADGLAYTTENVGLTYAINSTLSLDVRTAMASKEASGPTAAGPSIHNVMVTLKAGF